MVLWGSFAVFAYWIEPRKIEEQALMRNNLFDGEIYFLNRLSQSCRESLATPHARPDKGKPAAKLEVREKSEEVIKDIQSEESKAGNCI